MAEKNIDIFDSLISNGTWNWINKNHVLLSMQDGKVLDFSPSEAASDGRWKLFKYSPENKPDCLQDNLKANGLWKTITVDHKLIVMNDSKVLDWVPSDGSWRLWNYKPDVIFDCLPDEPVGMGKWKSIKSGHELIRMRDGKVLDWVPSDGSWRLWKYQPENTNDCLPGDPEKSGSWKSIKTGHELIKMYDGNVLDWVPSDGTYRLWKYDSTEDDILPGDPIAKGKWATIKTGHLLVPMVDGNVLDVFGDSPNSWKLWSYKP